jgi:hypothetical protein
MKKIILILSLAVVSNFSFAQQSDNSGGNEPSKTILYMNPFHFIGSTFSLGLESDFTKNGILLVGDVTMRQNSSQESIGIGGEIQYRIDVKTVEQKPRKESGKTYLLDIYGAPYFKYKYFEADYFDNVSIFDIWGNLVGNQQITINETVRNYGGGFVIGLRYTYYAKLSVDMYAGGGMQFSEIDGDKGRYENIFDYGYTGIMPKIGMRIGIVL